MSNVDESQPLITHLVELRNRLLRCVICVVLVFVALVYFSNDIYHFVAAPLTAVMPKGATMIATNIQTPFFTPIKLTAIVAVFYFCSLFALSNLGFCCACIVPT